MLTCIRALGIASDSHIFELLAPVISVSISNPCTELGDEDERPPAQVIFIVPGHAGGLRGGVGEKS